MGRWVMGHGSDGSPKSMGHGQSIKRSSFFGARSRSALLIIKKSGAPVFAPPIKKGARSRSRSSKIGARSLCAPSFLVYQNVLNKQRCFSS